MSCRSRAPLWAVLVSSALLLTGCVGDGDAESDTSTIEGEGVTESSTPTVTPAGTPEASTAPSVGSPEAIDTCGDALSYFYLDGTFNDRFNLDDVRVEGTRYVFENQSEYYDFAPGHPYASDPEIGAYVDTLVTDNDADIWCEQSGTTFNVGFVGGESAMGVTMGDLQKEFSAADLEIRKLLGLA